MTRPDFIRSRLSVAEVDGLKARIAELEASAQDTLQAQIGGWPAVKTRLDREEENLKELYSDSDLTPDEIRLAFDSLRLEIKTLLASTLVDEDRSFAALIEPLLSGSVVTTTNGGVGSLSGGNFSFVKIRFNDREAAARLADALSALSSARASERSSSQSSEKSAGLGGRDPIDDLIDIPKGEEFR